MLNIGANMKELKNSFLVFVTPFAPKLSFIKLNQTTHKGVVGLFALLITTIIITCVHYFKLRHSEVQIILYELIAFTLGFGIKIFLLSALVSSLTAKIYHQVNLKQNFAILSLSSLVYTIPAIGLLTTGHSVLLLNIITLFYFGSLIGIGFSYFYNKRLIYTVLLSIIVLFVAELIIYSFSGMAI